MSLYLGEKLISGIGQDRIADTLPIGAIIEWDSDLIPENWLLLNGQAVSRTVYSELFAIYGTTYGAGDGRTTFNLPDRRTRVAVGRDANDEDFAALGITGGKKDAVLPAHTHTRGTMDITGSISALGGSEFKFGSPTGAFWCTNTVDYYAATTNTSGSTRYDGMNFQASRNWTGETSEEGQDASSGNLQPYIVTNFIVKAKLYTTEFIGGNIVIDNLTSDSSVNVLSARMGKELDATDKVLDAKIQELDDEKLDKSKVIDYVIERGSKVVDYTSWKWEKWMSGKVEMWGYFHNPSVTFTTSQNGWYACSGFNISYPITLVSDEFGQYCYPSITGDTQNRMILSYVIPSANSIAVLPLNSAQQSSGIYTKLWIRATGRWK